MKVRRNGDRVMIEADGSERVVLVVAKNMAGLRDMAARRGAHSREVVPKLDESFPLAAKGMLAAFTLSKINDDDADDIIAEFTGTVNVTKKKKPAYGITVTVKLAVEKEFAESKEELLKALKNASVKVWGGLLGNLAVGGITGIKEVHDKKKEWEFVVTIELTVEKEYIGSKAKVRKALKNEGVKIDGHSFLTVGGITEVKEVRDTTIEWEERD